MIKFNLLVLSLTLTSIQAVPFQKLECNLGYQSTSPYCSWATSTPIWTRGTGQTTYKNISFDGPVYGPTTGHNYFIKVYKPTSMTSVDLLSPIVDSKTSKDCFSFFYYIHGEGVRDIELELISNGNSEPIWTRQNSAGDMWHLARINIGPQTSTSQLKFAINLGTGAIALGSFDTKVGICEGSTDCDFETGNCGWNISSSNPSYKFKLILASSSAWSSRSQDNQYDHSTDTIFGHFMEASGGKSGDVTTMTIGNPNGYSGKYCLQFWYWRHINQHNVIDAMSMVRPGTEPDIEWTSNYTYPVKTWHRALVNVYWYVNGIFTIRATKKASEISPVDIDDISLASGSCPAPINCDFDRDMCGWTRDLTQNYIWDHGIGRVEKASALPGITYAPFDFSLPKYGMYMYTDFTSYTGSMVVTMNMMSEYVPSTTGSCLSFHYIPFSFNNDNNKFNVLLWDMNGNSFKSLHQMGKSARSVYWLNMAFDIISNQSFRIVFQVTTDKASTYLALDNIIYRSGTCSGIAVTTLPPITTTVIPITSLSCDFEKNNLCGWTTQKTTGVNTIWATASSAGGNSLFQPKGDHTSGGSYGHYAVLYHSNNDPFYYHINDRKAVMSVTNNAVSGTGTTTPFCITLWYFMRTTSYVQLNVTVMAQNNSIVRFETRDDGQGEKWNILQLEAPGDKNGYVYIISAYAKIGQVSIDDISVKHEICQQSDSNTFKCTFEGSHNCSFAPLYEPNQMSLVWEIYKGNETFIKTRDHTLKTLFGHYFALDFHKLPSNAMPFNYEFISEEFRPTPQSCVTFSYYMYGLHKNESLTFYMVNSTLGADYGMPLWSVSGDMDIYWYSHRMTVSSQLKWKIMFGVQTNHTVKGLIAIDDVIVELDKACPPKGFCDFERQDTCMWESIPPTFSNEISQSTKMTWANLGVESFIFNTYLLNYTDFEWVVHSPDYGTNPFYPQTDHTLSKRSGNYLLLKAENPRRVGDRAILVSDHYDIPTGGSFCVKFYYFFINMNSIGSSRFELYQAENNVNYKKIAQVIGTSSNTTWVEFQITAKAMWKSSRNMWFYLFGDIGSLGTYLGIDDISITPGDCGVSPINKTFTCKPSNQTIPKSKLCDGFKDCLNGADELDCGSCKFKNKDDCGFHESVPENNDTLGYSFRFGNITSGPKSDPYGGPDFLVAQAYRYNRYIEISQLYSPPIHGADPGCMVYFSYNMNGTMNRVEPRVRWSHLTVHLNRSGFESTEIWNSDTINTLSSYWRTGKAVIGSVTNQYHLTYTAIDKSPTSGPGTFGYVALANIRMIDCKENYTDETATCSSNNYLCKNKRCIGKSRLCDYADDCGDGSDEMDIVCANYKLRCDFENGMCDWGRNRRDSWVSSKGFSTLTSGPTRDHTKGIRTGNFLRLSSEQSRNITSKILGPTLQKSAGCSMTLWLTMEGNTSNTGTLQIGAEDLATGYVTKIWETYPWEFPYLTFGFERKFIIINNPPNNYRIVFTGNLSAHGYDSNPSYIAIDDISFSPDCIATTGQSSTTPISIRTTQSKCGYQFTCITTKTCIDMSKVCNFHNDCPDESDEANCGECDFEGTDFDGQPSMCGWDNIGSGKNQWTIVPASISSRYSGFLPSFDSAGKSNGKYLIIDTSKGGTTRDVPAIMETPPLGATAPGCKLTFYYTHMYPTASHPTLSVILYKRIRSGHGPPVIKTLLEISPNTGWKQYSAHIGQLPVGHHIRFSATGTAYSLTAPYIDIALDEIRFVDCDPSVNVSTPSPLTCDFENGTCGWYDLNEASTNKLDWERTSSKYISPGYDHTGNIKPRPVKYGTWIYTRRQSGMYGNNTATLMSTLPQMTQNTSPMTPPKCLSFWYHMFGQNPANFSLMLNKNASPFTGTPTLLWIKRQPVSNNWMLAQVDIPAQTTPYYLMFRASLMSTSRDTIGLDDITYTDDSCPTTPICDFEVGFCSWSQIKYFTTQSPSTSDLKYPPIDHTLGAADGHYLLVVSQSAEMSFKIKSDFAQNISQPGSPNQLMPMCLKLWTYMGGPPGSTLTGNEYFEIKTTRNRFVDGYYGSEVVATHLQNQWIYKRYNFKAAVNDVLTIIGNTYEPKTVVAFDDIQIQKQACEQPGWCDFENDLCGWHNTKANSTEDQVLWLRNSGETESDGSGPSRDHTTDSEDGWYVYVPENAQSNGVALLESEILGPYYGEGQFCFSFYYLIVSETSVTSPKLSVSYYVCDTYQTTFVENISSSVHLGWLNYNFTLDNSPRIRVQLKTILGQTSRADVAIDDISIKPGPCVQTVSTVSTVQPSTTPEPASEKQWDCDFETYCRWNVNGTGWSTSAWYLKNVGPRADHTYRTEYGKYLLYDGNTANAPNTLYLSTDAVKDPFKSGTTGCLSLWYYIDSESKLNLTFGYYYVGAPKDYRMLYRLPSTISTRTWKQIQSPFNNVPGNKFTVQLQHSTPFSGSVAIDDIKMSLGACKFDQGGECDFTSGYCGYQVLRTSSPSGTGKIGWIATAQGARYFGPKTDHTTGDPSGEYFFFARVNVPTRSYETQLVIPDIFSTGFIGQCLKFWYQINTPTNSSFNIYVKPTTAEVYRDPSWTVPYTNFNRWMRGQLTIYAYYKHKIVFDMNLDKTSPNASFIALDDILVTKGACEDPIGCDFDVDMCSWSNVKTQQTNWNWAKFTSPPAINTNWVGPLYDHTMQKNGGSYLYMAVPQNSDDIYKIGEIESMTKTLKTTNCLSFWVQMIGTDTQLEAMIVRYGPKVSASNQTVSLSAPVVGQKVGWSKISFNIDPSQFPNTDVFAIRIRGKVMKSMSFIALDDILLSGGQCQNTGPHLMFCKGSGAEYNSSKRCNFVYDCPQKDDEDNCGNCDFEKDTCFWGNRYSNGEQWIRKAANDKGVPVGPTVDGSGSSSGHYLMVKPGTATSLLSDLVSNTSVVNQLKRSYFTCKMTFKYYMSGTALKSSTLIHINVGPDLYSTRTVWRMNGQVLNQWTFASADIGENEDSFNVDVYGATPGMGTTVAIDNIQFDNCRATAPTKGNCPSNQIKCKNNVCMNSYGLCDNVDDCGDESDESVQYCDRIKVTPCNFEINSGTKDSCNYSIEFDSGSTKLWTNMTAVNAYNYQNMLRMTGPTFDHTSQLSKRGTFLVLKGTPTFYGKKSKFITPMVSSQSGQTCALRFFYYMFGANVGSLTISVRYADQSIKSKANPQVINGNQGQQWVRAIYPYSDQKAFQFVIEGQLGNGPQSDIAIDDISFSEGCAPSNQKQIIVSTTTHFSSIGSTSSPTKSGPTVSTTTHSSSGGPFTHSSSVTPTTHSSSVSSVTPTKSSPIKHKSKSEPKKSNGGKIAAGVLVPVFVIGVILGLLFYRRHKQRQNEEERTRITEQSWNEGSASNHHGEL